MSTDQTICVSDASSASERTRFFARQLITPDDLTQNQIYLREKLRRHNRLLHGWGIVCGAEVSKTSDAVITITPGYILGPYGDEIVIESLLKVDIRQEDLDRNIIGPSSAIGDPWCSNVLVDRKAGSWHIAIRYAECDTRPVQVQPYGCGCAESECEYSRIRDSFVIKLFSDSDLPIYYKNMPKSSSLEASVGPSRGGVTSLVRTCSACPAEPWVILATIALNQNNTIGGITYTYRRQVVSFADRYITPTDPPKP